MTGLPKLHTLHAGARLIGVGVGTLRTAERNGDLIITRIGGRVYVTEAQLAEMIERCQHTQKARASASATPRRYPTRRPEIFAAAIIAKTLHTFSTAGKEIALPTLVSFLSQLAGSALDEAADHLGARRQVWFGLAKLIQNGLFVVADAHVENRILHVLIGLDEVLRCQHVISALRCVVRVFCVICVDIVVKRIYTNHRVWKSSPPVTDGPLKCQQTGQPGGAESRHLILLRRPVVG